MKCSFCDEELANGTGKLVVARDGSVTAFCSKKCERNASMRKSRATRWTGVYRKEVKKKGKK